MDFDIDQVAQACRRKDQSQLDRLWPEAYPELLRRARHSLRARVRGGTLDTSALLHDAYLKLQASPAAIADRNQFIAVCSTVMRCLVVDEIRRKLSAKRGGDWQRTTLNTSSLFADGEQVVETLDLENALIRLEEASPRLVHLVEMRFFGGMSNAEIAAALNISIATVKRDWLKAKAMLRGLLGAAPTDAARVSG